MNYSRENGSCSAVQMVIICVVALIVGEGKRILVTMTTNSDFHCQIIFDDLMYTTSNFRNKTTTTGMQHIAVAVLVVCKNLVQS